MTEVNSTEEAPDVFTFDGEDFITITDSGVFVRREESLRTKFSGEREGSGLRQVWFFRDISREEFCDDPDGFVEDIIEAISFTIRDRFKEHRDDPDKL